MNPLWNHPELEHWLSGLLTLFLIPLFYFVVWHPWFTPKRWKIITAVAFTGYALFYIFQFIYAQNNPSILRAPATVGVNSFAAAYIICEHLSLWFWPFGRDSILHPIDANLLYKTNLVYWLVLILVFRNLFRLRKKNAYAWYGMLWALVTLIPISGLWPFVGTPLTTQHLWFPGLGLAIAMASVIRLTGKAWTQHFKHIHRKVLFLTLNSTCVLWLVAAWVEVALRTTRMDSLPARIEYTLEHDPHNPAARAEQARQLARNGHLPQAETLIMRVHEATPWYPETDIIKAEILLHQGNFDSASEHLQKALLQQPSSHRLQTLLEDVARQQAALEGRKGHK